MDKKEESGRELLTQHCRSCGGYFIIRRTSIEHMTGKYFYCPYCGNQDIEIAE